MDQTRMPLGFGFALAMEPDALRNFAILPQEKKSQIMEKARHTVTREEMHSLINQLAKGNIT